MSGLYPGHAFGTLRSTPAGLGNAASGAGGPGAGGSGSESPSESESGSNSESESESGSICECEAGYAPIGTPATVGYEIGGDPSPIPYDNSKKCAEILLGTHFSDGEQQEGCGQSCHLELSMESTDDSQGTVEAQVYVQRKGSASASFLFGSLYNYGGGIDYTTYDDLNSCMGDRYYLVITYHAGGVPDDPDFYAAELVLAYVTPALSEYNEDCCEKSVETSHCDGAGNWTP